MEDEARNKEQLLISVLETVGEGITLSDRFGHFLIYNAKMEEITGYTMTEANQSADFLALLHPDRYSYDVAAKGIHDLLRNSGCREQETVIRARDGRRKTLLVSSSIIRQTDGDLFLSVYRDISLRKQIEDELKIKEYAIATSVNGIAIVDLEENITYANRSLLALWGYEERDVVSRRATAFWQDPDAVAGVLAALRKTGSWVGELAARRKDGSLFDAQLSATMVRDDENKPVCFLSSIVDVTEQKQKEKRLQESERQKKAILDSIPDMAWLKDSEGRFIAVNEPFGRACGTEPEALAGRTDFDIWPQDLAERYRADDRAVMSNNARKQVEEPLVHKDGRTSWIETIKTPICNEQGAVIGTSGIARDITGRKEAEERLRASEERFRTLVETISEWVWEVNEKGVYTYVSPRVRNVLGYEPGDLLGRTPFDLMPPEEAERVAGVFGRFVGSQTPFSALENINLSKDGRPVTLETSGVPFFNASGALKGYRGVDRDITERKKIEQEREQLIRELKNTLAKVKTLSGMLPICASCKKVRDDKGYWNQIEAYVSEHSEAEFSHGLCPDCMEKLYPDYAGKLKARKAPEIA